MNIFREPYPGFLPFKSIVVEGETFYTFWDATNKLGLLISAKLRLEDWPSETWMRSTASRDDAIIVYSDGLPLRMQEMSDEIETLVSDLFPFGPPLFRCDREEVPMSLRILIQNDQSGLRSQLKKLGLTDAVWTKAMMDLSRSLIDF